jgi:serralysin
MAFVTKEIHGRKEIPMTINILSSDSTTQINVNSANDAWIIQQDVYLSVNGAAISGTGAFTNRHINVDGHVLGNSSLIGVGILIGNDVDDGGFNAILIGETGSVEGSTAGISSDGGGLDLLNNGLIAGGNVALTMSGNLNSVLNNGTILSYDGTGMSSQGESAKIKNYGSISGATDGILLAGDLSTLVNGGSITSQTWALDKAAVHMAGYSSGLVNTGEITNLNSAGYSVLGGSGSQTVWNHGIVSGDVDLAGDNDTFHNENGSVIGDIFLGTGSDAFMSVNGSVTGLINGGSGDDSYFIDDAAINIVEYDSAGDDMVYSSVSYSLKRFFEDLVLRGGADLDGNGNSADNELTGNAGKNKLYGRGGNDDFFFSEGSDCFDGGAGSDTVYYQGGLPGVTAAVTVNLATGKGGGGATGQTFTGIENVGGGEFNDRLIGNAANNWLSGYKGNDILSGGGGKDIFHFYGLYGKDTVTDFHDKIDKIELNIVTIDSFDDLDGLISQKGKNVVIDLSDINAGDMLILKNTDLSDFSGKDFIFG